MKELLKKNSIYSIVQVIISGILLFFLYKFLLKNIGVELMGVWSLMLVTVSMGKLSELGFSSSVVKFVAEYRAASYFDDAISVVGTAVISVLFVVMTVAALVYYPMHHLLGLLLPDSVIDYGLLVLPYVLVTLCVNVIAGVFIAGLDGCQRIDLRSVLLVFGPCVNFISVIILLPEYGFIALAYSQLIQSILVLLLAFKFLSKEMGFLSLKWKKRQFMAIWKYAFVFQVTSLTSMTYDPVTKVLLTYLVIYQWLVTMKWLVAWLYK